MNTVDNDASEYAECLFDTVREAVIVLDDDLRVVSANRSFYRMFQVKPEVTENCLIYELGNGQWNIPQLRHLLERIIPEQTIIEDFKIRHRFESIGERVMLLNARRVLQKSGKSGLLLLAIADITELAAARRNLEESTATLNVLLNSVPEGIIIIDADHIVRSVSRYTGELLGVSPEKLINIGESEELEMLNFYLPNGERVESPDALPFFKAAITGEAYTDFEVTLKRDGVTRTISTAAAPVRDSRGTITGAIGSLHDITEWKMMLWERNRLLSKITAVQKRFEAVVENVPAGICVWIGPDFVYELTNSVYERFASGKQFIGRSFAEVWPEAVEPHMTILRKVLRTGEPYSIKDFPARIRRSPQGPLEDTFFDITYIQLPPDDTGKAGVLNIAVETTERKAAEESLKVERGRLLATLANIPDEMWITDASGRIIFKSDSVLMSLGKSDWLDVASALEELEPLNLDGIRCAPEDTPLPRALRGEFTQNVPEIIRNIKTGELHWREVSSSPIRDDSGKIIGAVAIARDVTARKRAEQELQKKTAQLEATINSIPDGYIIYDVDHNIFRMNAIAEKVLGFTRDEQKMSFEQRAVFLHPQTAAGEPFPIERIPSNRAFRGETVRDEIMRITRPDRNYWLSVSAAPIIAEDSNMLGVVMEFSDITILMATETALRENEASLKRSQAIAHLGSWEHDLVADHLIWSDEVYRIFGIPPKQFAATYEAFLEHVHPEDRSAVDAAYKGAVREGRDSYETELRVVREDTGEIRFVYVKCRYLRDPQGYTVRSLGTVYDITERRKAEEELRNSEEKFRAVFEQAAVGIARVRFKDATCIDVNTAFCNMIGYEAEELKRIPWPQLTHPDDIDIGLIPFRQMAKGELNSYSVEKRFIHKKKYYFWARLTLSLVCDEQKRPDYQIAIIEDINERKQTVEALQHRTEELAATNRELESFSYSVSHDLRNPLRVISGFSNILLEDYEERLDAEGMDYLRRIDSSVQNMQMLINDLLNLARLSRQEIHLHHVDLSAIVRNYLQELKAIEPERRVECTVLDNVYADADPGLIHLALENLLSNAWKFTAKKEVTQIEFGTFCRNGQTVYFFRDNGVGFEMKFAEKIFEPFKRVHSEREFGGTGVGLSIVYRVVGRHGGKVWAEGEVDKGAIFFFTLGKQ